MRNHLTIGSRRIGYVYTKPPTLEHGYAISRGTVVLLHAFPLNADMWEAQASRLPRGWALLAPDLRGFGESTLDEEGPGLDDYADDVIELLDRLHLDESVIGGLSMGGYVALALYRRAPMYFGGLVLADTRPQADSEEALGSRRRMLEVIDRQGAAGVADDLVPRLLSPSAPQRIPEVVAGVRRLIGGSSPEALRAAVGAMMARPDSTGLLTSIGCPTLVVVGEEDALSPVGVAEQMHRDIRRSVLEVIPQAGHLSNLEQPDAFSAALARFLEGVHSSSYGS